MNSLGLKLFTNKIDRLIFGLLLVLSAYFLPTYLLVVVSLIGIVIFSYYYEAAVVFFGLELVFGIPVLGWSPYYFLGTVSMLLGILIVEEIKVRVMV